MPGAHRAQKTVLQMVMSHHVGGWESNPVLQEERVLLTPEPSIGPIFFQKSLNFSVFEGQFRLTVWPQLTMFSLSTLNISPFPLALKYIPEEVSGNSTEGPGNETGCCSRIAVFPLTVQCDFQIFLSQGAIVYPSFVIVMGSLCVAQAGLRLTTLLPQPCEHRLYKHELGGWFLILLGVLSTCVVMSFLTVRKSSVCYSCKCFLSFTLRDPHVEILVYPKVP